jgi:hypothetical protein
MDVLQCSRRIAWVYGVQAIEGAIKEAEKDGQVNTGKHKD